MSSKNKILIFSLAYHPFVGGAEVAIKEITDRLPDFEFDMITTNLDGKQPEFEKMGNINVYRVGKSKLDKYKFPWLAYKKAQELHKDKKYNTTWAMMANQAGLAAYKFKKSNPEVKYLLTLQEGDSAWDIWVRTWFMRPLYKNIYRKADYIQAISSFLKKRAENLGAKCEIELIPNGIKKSEIQNSNFQSNPNDKNPKRIITTSRLEKKNGIEYLIRAFKQVVETHSNASLQIAGDGELREKLEQLTKELKIEDRVEFLGYVDQKVVYELLQSADVFCRPSLSEGLGNSFLEAMAMRVPVVATPVGGIPDFLREGETGWFCKVKDSKSIAEKINYILNPENKEKVEQVVENAHKLATEKYNWSDISQKMKNIFEKL